MVEKIKVDFKKKNGILACSPHILKLVREKFSIVNPSYQMRRIVPRLYSITPAGAFQIGLWNEVENYLRSLNIQLDISYTDDFTNNFNPILHITDISKIEGFDYYDYQEDSIREFLANGRGITLVATGGGKALIAGGLSKTLLDHHPDFKILIIVPTVGLLNQLHRSFVSEFGIESVTKWGDSNLPDLSKNIVIANSQILISDIAHTLSVVQDFDAVIIDEVHTINEKKNKISKVLHNITTPFKFGMTGTLPDSIMAVWNVIGKVGPILYEKTSYDLRKQDRITDVEIAVVVCSHTYKPRFPKNVNPTDAYNKEIEYIIDYAPRNAAIVGIVNKLVGNVLIVVDRLDYIDSLKLAFKDTHKKVLVISGNVKVDDRTDIQDLMEKEEDIILIAMTKCISTGISIKNLHYAVFTYMGKGGVKTVQTIGRLVRKHASKEKAVIFDISDDLEYSLRHLKQRLLIYKDQKIEYKLKKIII